MSLQFVRTEDHSPSLVHPGHGEWFHSRSGAWSQAREIYASGCRLAQRVAEAKQQSKGTTVASLGSNHPENPTLIRLLDLGTGLGVNLAAALAAVEAAGGHLDVLTAEWDVKVLHKALEVPQCGWDLPADFEEWHAHVRLSLSRALEAAEYLPHSGIPLGNQSRLRLAVGDITQLLPKAPSGWQFDAVFLDPFSPRTISDEAAKGSQAQQPSSLWSSSFLQHISDRLADGGLLATYSVSTQVRANLLDAGLQVGPGPGTSKKRETTLAGKGAELDPFSERAQAKIQACREKGID